MRAGPRRAHLFSVFFFWYPAYQAPVQASLLKRLTGELTLVSLPDRFLRQRTELAMNTAHHHQARFGTRSSILAQSGWVGRKWWEEML